MSTPHEHILTIRVLAPRELPEQLHVADISYFICTHYWQLQEIQRRSRKLSRAEAAQVHFAVDDEDPMELSPRHEVERNDGDPEQSLPEEKAS